MKLVKWLENEVKVSRVLFRNVPGLVMSLYLLSTVLMNLLASVAIVNTSWLALDAGIFVSFAVFLLMDMVVKRFGAKAAIRITVLGFLVNIGTAVLFTIVAFIAEASGQFYPLADYATTTQWWIIGASAAAFLISGVLDAVVHHVILKAFKTDREGIVAHAASAWGSTFLGQFIDNLLFGLLFTFPASMIGLWGMTPMTLLALFGFALAGGVVELVCQVILTPWGYKVAESWRARKVGQEYLDLVHKIKISR